VNFPTSGVEISPLIPFIVAFVVSFFTSMGGVLFHTAMAARYADTGLAGVTQDPASGSTPHEYGKTKETFDALDWLALLTTHIPNRGEQMVRYYGYYSNKSRGMRKKAGRDNEVSALIDSDVSRKAFRKNWARLIQKIYNVDPPVCPTCHGQMRVISFIEQPEIIENILKHLDLWETRNHDPPARKAAHIPELIIDPSYSQLRETEYWLQ
jgi:hypothetical protein